MKIKGHNAQAENVKLLKSMFKGKVEVDEPGDIDVQEVDQVSQKILNELEKYFIKLRENTSATDIELEHPTIDDNNEIRLKRGDVFHTISADDSYANLVERIKSIAKYGLLASEWFGIRYDSNEIPFKVGFHKVVEDCKFKDLKMFLEMSRNSKTAEISKNNDILFFVNQSQPLLRPLFDSEKTLALDRELSSVNINDPETWEKKARASAESYCEDEYNYLLTLYNNNFINPDKFTILLKKNNLILRNMVEHFAGEDIFKAVEDKKYTVEEAVEKIKNLNLNIEDVKTYARQIAESSKEKRYQQNLESRKLSAKHFEKTIFSVYVGVPAAFISAIRVPQKLENNSEFINLLHSLFPNAIIFGSLGNVLVDVDNFNKLL